MLSVWVKTQSRGQVFFQVSETSGHWLILKILTCHTHHLDERRTSSKTCTAEYTTSLDALLKVGCLQLPTRCSRRGRTQILSFWMLIFEHLHKKKSSAASTLSSHVSSRDLSSHYTINAYWAGCLSEKHHFTSHYAGKCGIVVELLQMAKFTRKTTGQYFMLETLIPMDFEHPEC